MSRKAEGLTYLSMLVALLIFAGWAITHPAPNPPPPPPPPLQEFSLDHWSSRRVHDAQYKLTCWSRYENEGVDSWICVPDAFLNYQPK